ncbi:hypothetical protein PRIPAC_89111 [Pristionchus pacificus]|uniref:Uncharacterized protein n=1 Tax=Pristionchus pacificus TaxID=54126 RepID=A0A2A6B8S9_PRIPA|nr:hypothetical protein PRIPAC_89111 [Pristionchus pacificus]|eukprot:PDM62278.1 hypothetical protein PRIPAC_51720 [Pristionchus pacificus]
MSSNIWKRTGEETKWKEEREDGETIEKKMEMEMGYSTHVIEMNEYEKRREKRKGKRIKVVWTQRKEITMRRDISEGKKNEGMKEEENE